MEPWACDSAIHKALSKERPKRIIDIINATLKASNAIPQSLDFICLQCREEGPEGRARAFFSAPPPTIVFCANRLRSERELEEAMTHELIHAYDFIVRGMDITQSRLLACSEIRAARESECYEKAVLFSRLFPNFQFVQDTARGIQERCVQLHAVRSTQSMFPAQAKRDVEEMFHQCYADLSPFE